MFPGTRWAESYAQDNAYAVAMSVKNNSTLKQEKGLSVTQFFKKSQPSLPFLNVSRYEYQSLIEAQMVRIIPFRLQYALYLS